MEKEVKTQTAFRLRAETINYLREYKEQYQLSSMTKAFELIVNEHQAASINQNENIANSVVEKIEKKYGNALTRIRLGTNAADVNIQILMEIINSLLVQNFFEISEFTSISTLKASLLEQAEHETKAKIAHYKQRKDSKKKEGKNNE